MAASAETDRKPDIMFLVKQIYFDIHPEARTSESPVEVMVATHRLEYRELRGDEPSHAGCSGSKVVLLDERSERITEFHRGMIFVMNSSGKTVQTYDLDRRSVGATETGSCPGRRT